MNPGYLSYIAITLSVILMSFGWRSQAIGNGSLQAALWFSAAWIVSVTLHWDVMDGVSGTFAYLPLLALIVVVLGKRRSIPERASVITFAMLLGAVVSLIQLLEAVDPLVIVIHPVLDPLLLLWVLIVLYTRSAVLQFVVLSMALLVNDAYMALMYMEWEHAYFGDRTFQDAWWLSAIAIRTGTVSFTALRTWNVRLLSRLLGLFRLRK